MLEHTDDPLFFRTQLRQATLAARALIPPASHVAWSNALCAHLAQWLSDPKTLAGREKSLGFCLPYRDECDIMPLITQLNQAGWKTSVPVVLERAQAMRFRHWWPGAPLVRDIHGISIPDSEPCASPAFLLLPVVAVDKKGYRLGYGGGYFDRTLAELAQSGKATFCIGVGFSLALTDTIYPQAHDQALQALVTDTGLHLF